MQRTQLLSGTVAAAAMAAVVAALAMNGHPAQATTQTGQASGPQTQPGQAAGQSGRGGQETGATTEPLMSPGPAASRYPRNADEFDRMFNEIKNWGRWGSNDELGAANLITDAKRKQALSLGKLGIAVGLAHPPVTELAPDTPSPFEHTMNRGFTSDT